MKVYICETYYHLLIAIIKNLKCKGENELILASEFLNDKLVKDKDIINNLNKFKIFRKVHFFDYADEQKKNRKSKIHFCKDVKLIKKIYKSKKYKFLNDSEIYIFYDSGLLGRYLNYFKINYNLIEDGTDCFKNNSKYWEKEFFIKKYIKEKIFHFYTMGQSPLIKTIEINDKTGVKLPENKIVEIPKKKLFEEINEEDKETIFKIFLSSFDVNKFNDCSLLITQPLWIDGKLDSEQKQMEMYKYIINKYMSNEKIIIKTHPREKSDYEKYFKDSYIINKPFPIEILSFCKNLSINKVITVSSTSINSITFAKKIISLGWDWFYEYKKQQENIE